MPDLPNAIETITEPFMRRIENRFDELESLRGVYMNDCKAVREEIKEIYGEAKDHGVPVRALKGLVRYRQLERRQMQIADALEEEAADYELLIEQLGDLGIAAARAAGRDVAGAGIDAH